MQKLKTYAGSSCSIVKQPQRAAHDGDGDDDSAHSHRNDTIGRESGLELSDDEDLPRHTVDTSGILSW